jgi:hypothetical protein
MMTDNNKGRLCDNINTLFICRWLNSLGLSAYIDNFQEQGLVQMLQLDDFTIEVGNHSANLWSKLLFIRAAVVWPKGDNLCDVLTIIQTAALWPKGGNLM